MTDTEKLLALIALLKATMNRHQIAAAQAAWLKLVEEAEKKEKVDG